jgi:S-formylglutathione hydrolase FrmB
MGSGLTRFSFLSGVMAFMALPTLAATPSRIESRTIASKQFAHNKIGLRPDRAITVYLPAGYNTGRQRYPVIYILPNLFDTDTTPFTSYGAQAVFDAAITKGLIGEVIIVSADFSTPLGSSLYVNSPVTGNWEDYMVSELVPYIDRTYSTLPAAASRGVAGDRMGGHGAIRFGMKHPDVFGSVYALHPVGTGSGVQIMQGRPNWDILSQATALEDVKADIFSQIFTAIYQAHLPNTTNAPLFVDLPAKKINGELVIDTALTAKLQDGFFLERMIPTYADNLKRLNGFKFDWGRNDGNFDHVYSNQAFAHKLDEFGIAYEAEEYRGSWGERHWGSNGRVMTDLLPFFAQHLAFA